MLRHVIAPQCATQVFVSLAEQPPRAISLNPQKPTCTQNPRPRPHEKPVTQARKIRDLQQVKVRPQNKRFDPCSDEPGRAGLKSPWEEIFHNRGKVSPPRCTSAP